MWKKLMKNVDMDEPTSFHDRENLGRIERERKTNEINIDQYKEMSESRLPAGATRRLRGPTTWKDMLKNALKDNANKKTEQLYKVSSPCLDYHQFKKEELESVGELSTVCSQIVLKCLYLARIGRLDILWSENKLARAARLISHIHHTSEFQQFLSCGKHCTTMQAGTVSEL